MSHKHGKIAENYFSLLMHKQGLEFKFVNDWYDYEIENRVKVELKSCQPSILQYSKHKEAELYRVGRFDFTDEDNREKLIKEDVWIALVVRFRKEAMFLGFIKGSSLNGNRYLSLHHVREKGIISLSDFILMNNLKQERRNCHCCGNQYVL